MAKKSKKCSFQPIFSFVSLTQNAFCLLPSFSLPDGLFHHLSFIWLASFLWLPSPYYSQSSDSMNYCRLVWRTCFLLKDFPVEADSFILIGEKTLSHPESSLFIFLTSLKDKSDAGFFCKSSNFKTSKEVVMQYKTWLEVNIMSFKMTLSFQNKAES